MDVDTSQVEHDQRENGCDKRMEVKDSEVTSSGEAAKVPIVGMTFSSEEEVFQFYDSYGQSLGFSIARISTKNGDDGKKKYFTLACARNGKTVTKNSISTYSRTSMKTNCRAKINVAIRDDESLVITRAYLEHNHELVPEKRLRVRRNKVGNSDPRMKSKSNDVDSDGILVEGDVSENLTCCAKECTAFSANGRQMKLDAGDLEALLVYLYRMQSRNLNFFYQIDTDKKGRIRNVFWADAWCRNAYEKFGDIVLFDTTSLLNNYNAPLCSFIGRNHHGHEVLLGCALVWTANKCSFIWLFKSWLTCMLGRPPNSVITGYCDAIRAAAAEVFPNSRYRQCLGHILTKLPMKLGRLDQYKVIKKTLKTVVYDSLKSGEFEEGWASMIKEFKLEDHEWLKSLYNDRHHWVPMYVKHCFWAGMSLTERGDRLNSFFDDCFNSKMTIKKFVDQYDSAMKSRIEKENNANTASCASVVPTITNHPIEKRFQEVYTNDIFKLFQDEIRGLVFCNASFVKAEGSISVFEVTETVLDKDGIFQKEITLEVFFDEVEYKLQCLCHLFEVKGILCKHAISVYIKKKVIQLPSCYILDRWRKDLQSSYQSLADDYDDIVNNAQTERCRRLRSSLFLVQRLALESDGKCELLVKLLEEAKCKLLSFDEVNGNRQRDQVSVMPQMLISQK
ncbi:OLC1v1026322C5 [Oldenlandia corymbosa var. corymbosa]|uniref:Protein FAR1-RELATED SEQUENCE n=1 Tax=Oldenlandia corymbosa var. corymbosa TaxID=529605 RepID=A0AAV1C9S3_OLDCO|nr:OLC1v1026322C5 [Oldenlandia corymbosa var. corymbosa]